MGRRICTVPGCTSDSISNKSVGFHQIPVQENTRIQWIKVILTEGLKKDTNWNPEECSVVCGKHFLPDDYKQRCKNKILKRTAVPSVFPSDLHSVQPKQHRRKQIIQVKNDNFDLSCQHNTFSDVREHNHTTEMMYADVKNQSVEAKTSPSTLIIFEEIPNASSDVREGHPRTKFIFAQEENLNMKPVSSSPVYVTDKQNMRVSIRKHDPATCCFIKRTNKKLLSNIELLKRKNRNLSANFSKTKKKLQILQEKYKILRKQFNDLQQWIEH